jgi:uncharacterized MAPEG superfamily protein
MRRAALSVLLACLAVLLILSCSNEVGLSHELRIVNNSSRDVERVGLGYTGIKSRAFAPPDFQTAISVPAGQTRTVELTLEPSTAYSILFIYNDTASKSIIWAGGTVGYDYVLLSQGGASTCTVDDLPASCLAGENSVTPYVHIWP